VVDVLRIEQTFSKVERASRWAVPRRLEPVTQWCDVTLVEGGVSTGAEESLSPVFLRPRWTCSSCGVWLRGPSRFEGVPKVLFSRL